MQELEKTNINPIVYEQETAKLDSLKNKLSIPKEHRSCHTSFFGKYFVEGHVPFEVVYKLLSEQPDIDGIALGGMPSGTPGMEGDKVESFNIVAITDGVASPYVKQ